MVQVLDLSSAPVSSNSAIAPMAAAISNVQIKKKAKTLSLSSAPELSISSSVNSQGPEPAQPSNAASLPPPGQVFRGKVVSIDPKFGIYVNFPITKGYGGTTWQGLVHRSQYSPTRVVEHVHEEIFVKVVNVISLTKIDLSMKHCDQVI